MAITVRGARATLIGTIALLVMEFGLHLPSWGQLPDSSLDRVNDFPITAATEVVRGQSQHYAIEFNVYFSVDKEHYVPVKPELAQLLSLPPEVHSPPGLEVRVISTKCTPRKLTVLEQTAIVTVFGGAMRCEIEITPHTFLEAGAHDVTLSFDSLAAAFLALKSNQSQPRPEARLTVQVWASLAAKQEAERRAAEEKRRREEADRKAQRWAEEQRQEEARLAAQRRWERIVRALKLSLMILGAAAPFGLVFYARRKWLWPRVKAKVAAGDYRQYRGRIAALSGEEHVEPGTILQTLWAQDRWGRRQRIKVEVFVADGETAADEPQRADDSQEDRSHDVVELVRFLVAADFWWWIVRGIMAVLPFNNVIQRNKLPPDHSHDVLIAVGASVRCGMYLAKTPGGSVRIRVP